MSIELALFFLLSVENFVDIELNLSFPLLAGELPLSNGLLSFSKLFLSGFKRFFASAQFTFSFSGELSHQRINRARGFLKFFLEGIQLHLLLDLLP